MYYKDPMRWWVGKRFSRYIIHNAYYNIPPTKMRLLGYYIYIYKYIIIAGNKSRRRACAPWKCTIRLPPPLAANCCHAMFSPYCAIILEVYNTQSKTTRAYLLPATSNMPRNPITILCYGRVKKNMIIM